MSHHCQNLHTWPEFGSVEKVLQRPKAPADIPEHPCRTKDEEKFPVLTDANGWQVRSFTIKIGALKVQYVNMSMSDLFFATDMFHFKKLPMKKHKETLSHTRRGDFGEGQRSPHVTGG